MIYDIAPSPDARVKIILAAEEAIGREVFARHLAFHTDLTAEEAVAAARRNAARIERFVRPAASSPLRIPFSAFG